jgi:acetyltransferase
VIVARSGLEMIDVARALDAQPPPRGPRVAVITNSGGTGVELADLLADEGLEVPELSAALQEELRALLPPLASARNPVDITPVWRRFAELYPLLVDRLARCGEVDAVVPVLLQRSAEEPVARAVRDAVTRLRADRVPVPVYVCWVAPRTSRPSADLLQDAGVPCFEWPERTARALGHAARYGVARTRVRAPDPGPARPAGLGTLTARMLDAGAAGMLDAGAAAGLLAAVGIATVPGRTCTSVAAAQAAAADLGYPVVAKALHPSLVHKSEAGAVRLDLRDPAAVRAATTDLLDVVPGARVLVQRQVTGVEVVVGGVRDPQFGAVVMVGLGGIFVEVIDDVALGLAPLRRNDAYRLLRGLRGHAVLAGARGTRPVDLDAVSDVICAVGDLLLAAPEIAELDLNPLLASIDGCVAVDWRVRVENPPVQDEERVEVSPRHAGETNRRRS